MYIIGFVLWIVVGMIVLRFARDGWLIMLTDKRNIRNTWVALPALFLTWLLWPLAKVLPRWIFMFMITFGL